MATREDIIAWADASKLFEDGKYNDAINIFNSIVGSLGAKIHFNIGICYGYLNRLNEAIDALTQAVKADKYFAAAFFQRGVFQILSNAFGKAVQDFSFANEHLRGNAIIDYTQLGLDYRLYLSEVLYNRAICKTKLNDRDGAYNDLLTAQSVKLLPEHDVIDAALSSQKYQTHFSIGKHIYHPPEQKVKNAGKVDYLGSSKIIASSDPSDNIIGFKDAQLRKQALQSQQSNSNPRFPPGSSVPPPRPSVPPPGSSPPVNMNMPPGGSSPPVNMNMPPGANMNRPPPPSNPPPGANMNRPPPPSNPPPGASSPPVNMNMPPGGMNRPPPPSNPPPGSNIRSGSPSPQVFSQPASSPPVFSQPASSPPVFSQPASSAKMGSGSSVAPGSKIKIKCHHKDTRVILIDSGIKYEELIKKVEEKFDGIKLKIKYKDEDGDLILLTDQEDLDMAFSTYDLSSNKLEFWCT